MVNSYPFLISWSRSTIQNDYQIDSAFPKWGMQQAKTNTKYSRILCLYTKYANNLIYPWPSENSAGIDFKNHVAYKLLSLHPYVYIYTCIHTYIYMYINNMCVYINICTCRYIYMYIYMYMYTCIYKHVGSMGRTGIFTDPWIPLICRDQCIGKYIRSHGSVMGNVGWNLHCSMVVFGSRKRW